MRLDRVLVMGLASWRATRVVTQDRITAHLRDTVLVNWAYGGGPNRKREFVATLLRCPTCLGWWLSMVTALVAHLAGRRRRSWWIVAIEAWAVAGVQSALEEAATSRGK